MEGSVGISSRKCVEAYHCFGVIARNAPTLVNADFFRDSTVQSIEERSIPWQGEQPEAVEVSSCRSMREDRGTVAPHGIGTKVQRSRARLVF